jgi:hypothetical protein
LFGIALSLYFLQSCRKSVDPIPNNFEYVFQSQVIDAETRVGVAGAKVMILGESVQTDSDGFYYMSLEGPIPDVSFEIVIEKEGYIRNTYMTDYTRYISLPIIRLLKVNEVVVIGKDGGEVIEASVDGLETSEISITIPPNALSENTNISCTPLEPRYTPDRLSYKRLGLLNTSTIHLEPLGLKLSEMAEIKAPLPVKMDQGTEIPLLAFNYEKMHWEESTTKAIVDETGLNAMYEVSEFTDFSMGIEGGYEEWDETEKCIDIFPISKSSMDDIIYCTEDSIIYPEGFPTEEMSYVWAVNTVAVITEINGGQAFLDESCYYSYWTGFNYCYQNCACPDPGDGGECLIRSYYEVEECSKTGEIFTVRWRHNGVLILRELKNVVYKCRTKICWEWVEDPDCHEGGAGS